MMIDRNLAGVSAGIAEMPRSGIRELMDAAWQIPGAILLGVGEPNFPTPPHVVEAAHAAALAGKTGYVSNAGIVELREALAAKIRERNGYDVTPDNLTVSNGGVEGIFAALAAVLEPGDGVLIPDPGWPNFAMMAGILRARVQRYPLVPANDFLPTIDELERACDDSTRVLLLNSPSNPLGAVIDRARMREIAAFADAHDLWIVSDECYDATLFDDRFVSAAAVADPERTIAIYTFSKTYAMTGWRVGYVAAPARATAQIAKLQEPLISCVNAPAQYAALAALTGPQAFVAEMNAAYRERRDEVFRRLERRRRSRAAAERRLLRVGRRSRRRPAEPRLRLHAAARAQRRDRARNGLRPARRRLRAHLARHRTVRFVRRHRPSDRCARRAERRWSGSVQHVSV